MRVARLAAAALNHGVGVGARQEGAGEAAGTAADGADFDTLKWARPDCQNHTRPLEDKTAWNRLRAVAEEEVHAAALADPDAQPLTNADLARMKRVPRIKTLRRALRLTQEEFATQYDIPLGILLRLRAGVL